MAQNIKEDDTEREWEGDSCKCGVIVCAVCNHNWKEFLEGGWEAVDLKLRRKEYKGFSSGSEKDEK